MASLVPGAIFQTTGFNRNSTPTPPNITPSQLNNRYNRGDFDGRPWPHDSPVSRMYDVQNTSTKMIILNNKFGKSGTRLRGYYSGPQKPDRTIDPNRHRAMSPRNPDHHTSCYDSSSPKFEPSIRVNLDWYSSLHRPENALAVKSSVNPRRHTSCLTPRETMRFPHEEKQRIPIPPARFFSAKEFSDMSLGEKIYMWSIEKIYNVENLKKLKQDQYKKLLQLEAKKGYHGFQQYQKYLRYINSASSRSYGTGSPRSAHSPAGSRARSAFSTRGATSPAKSETKQDGASSKADSEAEEQARPKTALGITPPESPAKKDTPAVEKETEQKPQEMQLKSPAPSRKSSAKSTRSTASARSIKSRSSVRPPSTSSSKRSASLPKAEHSDSSLSIEGESPSKHKEGRDRPKSRLGHMSAEDRDKGVIHSSLSSLSSVRSDKHSSSEDSGLEKDKVKTKKHDSRSNSSRGSRVTGSNISLGSRKSDNGLRTTAEGTQKKESLENKKHEDKISLQNDEIKDKDTKIHSIPSASFDKDDTTDEKEAKPEAEEPEPTEAKEPEPKEQEKSEETLKTEETDDESKEEAKEEAKHMEAPKASEDKIINNDSENNILENEAQADAGNQQIVETDKQVAASDEIKETKSAENTEKHLTRQDSLEEEEEDDRRVNKDLDKIEY